MDVTSWVARPEVLRRAWTSGQRGTPFGVPQGVPPRNLLKSILGEPLPHNRRQTKHHSFFQTSPQFVQILLQLIDPPFNVAFGAAKWRRSELAIDDGFEG